MPRHYLAAFSDIGQKEAKLFTTMLEEGDEQSFRVL